MRKMITHIIAFVFLLVIAGFRIADISQNTPVSYAEASISSPHIHSIKLSEPKIFKQDLVETSIISLDVDDSDFSISNPSLFVAVITKLVVFGFLLLFLDVKFRKRRIDYQAFIQLFTHKYIVLRTLRI